MRRVYKHHNIVNVLGDSAVRYIPWFGAFPLAIINWYQCYGLRIYTLVVVFVTYLILFATRVHVKTDRSLALFISI